MVITEAALPATGGRCHQDARRATALHGEQVSTDHSPYRSNQRCGAERCQGSKAHCERVVFIKLLLMPNYDVNRSFDP
jgi:hypothetical protein